MNKVTLPAQKNSSGFVAAIRPYAEKAWQELEQLTSTTLGVAELVGFLLMCVPVGIYLVCFFGRLLNYFTHLTPAQSVGWVFAVVSSVGIVFIPICGISIERVRYNRSAVKVCVYSWCACFILFFVAWAIICH